MIRVNIVSYCLVVLNIDADIPDISYQLTQNTNQDLKAKYLHFTLALWATA